MTSTYTSLHYHIVYSTKHRIPLISKSIIPELHKYLAGATKGQKGHPIAIGGVEDHVHMLVSLPQSARIDYFVRDVKKESSKWMHGKGVLLFEWQVGYAAFTVSPNVRQNVFGYVMKQESHHKKVSFIDELKELLDSAGIRYDPKYLE